MEKEQKDLFKKANKSEEEIIELIKQQKEMIFYIETKEDNKEEKIIKEKITAIIVTHDISEAISMSDRVLVLSKRPGTIKDIHKIDFEIENRTPLNCRESPKFSKYFNTLWKELGVDD